jgi:predicted ribosome quality control (RQC) complex YloA/Tae2 family protein
MKTQLSSLEIYHLTKELQLLVDSKIDKIYHPSEKEILIQIYVKNQGRKILRILVPNFLYLTETKHPSSKDPTEFCLYLRRKLEGSRIISLQQKNHERIIELTLQHKENTFHLIIELFSRGNLILCDPDYIIISLLERQIMKARKINMKETYVPPEKEYNFFTLTKSNLTTLLNITDYDAIVKTLAADTGLGGIYAEEICSIANINKDKKPIDINDDEQDQIISAIKKLKSRKPSPQVTLKDNIPVDLIPFKMHHLKQQDLPTPSTIDSINLAIEKIFSNFALQKSKSLASAEKKLQKTRKMIDDQKLLITQMEKKELELKQKADIIYHNYQTISSLLNDLEEISKKHPWKEIQKKLQGHKVIKLVDPKEKTITVELN